MSLLRPTASSSSSYGWRENGVDPTGTGTTLLASLSNLLTTSVEIRLLDELETGNWKREWEKIGTAPTTSERKRPSGPGWFRFDRCAFHRFDRSTYLDHDLTLQSRVVTDRAVRSPCVPPSISFPFISFHSIRSFSSVCPALPCPALPCPALPCHRTTRTTRTTSPRERSQTRPRRRRLPMSLPLPLPLSSLLRWKDSSKNASI